MMVSSGLCKTKAEQCAKLTPYVETPRMRVALANVERTWLKLADQCRRLDELNETIESPAIAPLMDNAYSAGADAEEDYTSDAAVAELERIGSAMDKVGSW
jgi:hypothetical protein